MGAGIDPAELILVGRILRAHGVRGDVVVTATGNDPARLAPGTTLFVGSRAAAPRRVQSARWLGGSWIVRLDGCEDRDAAGALTGNEVFVAAEALPPLPPGEYYQFQLVGLAVIGADGRELGRLVGVIALPGQDLYEVEGPQGSLLVPGRREFVEWIDLERGELRLTDRADLLEAQAPAGAATEPRERNARSRRGDREGRGSRRRRPRGIPPSPTPPDANSGSAS